HRAPARTPPRSDAREPVTAEQTVAIEMIEQLRAVTGEEHLHGIFLTAQNQSQLCPVSRTKERLRKMSGMLLEIFAQDFIGGIRRLGKTACRFPLSFLFPK